MCNFAGGKATEWVPLIPGTDGAVALAMANVILNEIQAWDAEFLQWKTNLPFLVKPDGHFARAGGSCLVWDASGDTARKFDDPALQKPALTGTYRVDGEECVPVFAKLRQHLQQFTPEWAFSVSSVPAGQIRRIAREFVENARIGSTIEIEGKVFPFRQIYLFRGPH